MIKRLCFIVVLTMHIVTSLGCPRVCRCDERRKMVNCNERNLNFVPHGIPTNTKVLYLQHNNIGNSPSLEQNLSKLKVLEKLYIYSNKITSFPANLPSSLVYVSLRQNNIKFIGKTALRGLSNLRELHLDSNNITIEGLSEDAFSPAVNLQELIFTQNSLTHVPSGLPRSLISLRVANNRISDVTAASLSSLSKLIVLDFSNNELNDASFEDGSLKQLENLRTIDLSDNHITNIPTQLPGNITNLILSRNKIQYIFAAKSEPGEIPIRGDLQSFPRLKKLDLSSNQLHSVEKGAFTNLPSAISVELHGNPWRCDCNLQYLKRWMTYTTSVVRSSEGNTRCATPAVFSDVTVNSLDLEALRCTHSSYAFNVLDVTPDSVTIEYDVISAEEPPYVTFSIMYGTMLCDGCSIPDDNTKGKHPTAAMWMGEYTIIELNSENKRIEHLTPNTTYAMCIVTSYQHPDQIGVEQCQDVTTYIIPTFPTTLEDRSVPMWAYIAAGCGFVLLLALAITVYILWKRRIKNRLIEARRYRQQIPQHYLPQFMVAREPGSAPLTPSSYTGKPLPLLNANNEFDVTLMVRPDANLSRRSDSCYSDSHDESVVTNHTSGTGRSNRCEQNSSGNQSDSLLPNNNSPHLHDSGLFV
ncbi:leucine-rich repeat transmembrane protein FLRT2 [Ciona intestinalis]